MSQITKHDRELLDKMFSNKKRYSIKVDNDAIYVQDNHLSEDDEDYWVPFNDYGYDFVVTIFQYLGFDSDYV